MASTVDDTIPVATTPAVAVPIRTNFQRIKSEITALQNTSATNAALAALAARVAALESVGPGPSAVPVVTPGSIPGTVGTAITPYPVAATNHPILSYAVAPALPSALTLNTGTGEITGIPAATQPATNYTVTATNAVGPSTGTNNLSITITSGAAPTGWEVTYSFPGTFASFTRTSNGSIPLTSLVGWQPAYAADVNDSLYDALTPAAVPVKLYATYAGQSEVLVDFDNWPGTSGTDKITDWGYHHGTTSIYIRGTNTTSEPIALRLVRE